MNKIGAKRLKYRLIAIAMVLIVAAFYFYYRYNYLISSPVDPSNTQTVYFEVKKGEAAWQISKKLFDKKLSLDSGIFTHYSKFSGIDKDIKPGRYPLSQSMTLIEVGKMLTSNENRQIVLTIPEGYTVSDIDKNLTELSLIQPGDFEKAVKNYKNYSKYAFLSEEKMSGLVYPLEGYLFPDTYFVDPNNFDTAILIDLMLKDFKARTANLNITQESMIVASMVEKEANNKNDRYLVAGIILKRLKEQWVLGIDATLLYLKDNNQIDYQDLQEDSPYNTRKVAGLPPGPICNPGLDAITAALDPKASPYYYYLTGKDGEMKYAVSNDEHNLNKQRYL